MVLLMKMNVVLVIMILQMIDNKIVQVFGAVIQNMIYVVNVVEIIQVA